MKKYKILFIFLVLSNLLNAQDVWTRRADFPLGPRGVPVGFSIGLKGYIVTGNGTGNTWLQDLWEWDQSTNTWTQMANLPGLGRGGAIGFSIGTKGYIGTGSYNNPLSHFLCDFWEWDQTNNIWIQRTNFPGGVRSGAVGFSIENKGYIGLGASDTASFNDLWEWDQLTDTWLQKADFPGGIRVTALGISSGTKGYVGIGYNFTNQYYKDFWEFDPITNIWTQKADFAGGIRASAIGFSINNNCYVGIGDSASNIVFDDFWEWNQASNTWIQKANFGGIPRSSSIGLSVNNKGYIFGGMNVIYFNDFWEYTPDTTNGIPELFNNKLDVFVFPNPSNGVLNLNFKNSKNKEYDIRIYDITFKLVYSDIGFKENYLRVSLDSIPKGIYYVQIKNNNDLLIKKIIIE